MGLQLITGYPSSWKAPFVAAEILFAQGASSAAAGRRDAHYCVPKTASGTWVVNTTYLVANEQEAVQGGGAGSMAHRVVRMHLRANPGSKVYVTVYDASSGAGVATATGTITVAGAPTAAGQFRVWVCGEKIDTNFTTSSTATTIAADLVAKINAKTFLPLTASNVAGVITLTAKHAGASQGDGTVGIHRFRAEADPGKGITTPVAVSGAALGLGTGTPGVDGATTELANLTAALATIANTRFYYQGFTVWNSTDTAVIETHIATKSQPSPGLRSTGWSGYTGTLANCSTLAIARNAERHHVVWQKNSEHDVAELVANTIAVVQKHEEVEPAFPGFDRYRRSDWLIQPAYANADWPSDIDENDAVTDGIIPIRSDQSGSYIGMMVNTRSKDAAGTLDDFRATERHRVSVMDFITDTMVLQFVLTYISVGFKLSDDIKNADGTVNVNRTNELGPKTLTPLRFRPWLNARFEDFGRQELLQNVQFWKDSARINIDPQNSSRLEVGASGRTIDILHQASFKLSETSPG